MIITEFLYVVPTKKLETLGDCPNVLMTKLRINTRMIGRRCKIITFENVDEAEKKVQINLGFGQLF